MILDHFELRDLADLPLAEQEQAMEAFLDRWRAAVAGRRALLFVDEQHSRVLVLNAGVFRNAVAA